MISDETQLSLPRLPEEIRASEAIFDSLFQKIRPDLLRRVARDVKDAAAVEDILQQTAGRVLRALRSGKMGIINGDALFVYCATTAYRLSLSHLAQVSRQLRTEAPREPRDDKADILERIPHPRQAHPETFILLREVYEDLSADERVIFSQMFLGHSAEEVGKHIGKTSENIAVIRYRATRKILKKYGTGKQRSRRSPRAS